MSRAVILALALAFAAGCNETRRDRNGGAGGPGAHPLAPPLEVQGFNLFTTGAGQRVSVPDTVERGSSVQYLLDEIDNAVPEGQDKPWRELLNKHPLPMLYLHPWYAFEVPSAKPGALVSGVQSDRGGYVIASIGVLWEPFPADGTAIPSLEHELGHVVKSIPDHCARCTVQNGVRYLAGQPLGVRFAK